MSAFADQPAAQAMRDLTQLDGSKLSNETLANDVVLVVNVASKCGYTKQYAGLQALHDKFKDKGFSVVGVPCNQFGAQEPGSPEQIASFCQKNFGVTFPILEKQKVNGDERSSLYTWLVSSEAGGGQNIKWNFEKFLVGKDGKVIKRYRSGDTPESIQSDVQAALAR